MQTMHEAGYVYNDLKPDNILLDYESNVTKSGKNVSLNVIDFGFSTKIF